MGAFPAIPLRSRSNKVAGWERIDEEATTHPQHGLAHENPGDAADLIIP